MVLKSTQGKETDIKDHPMSPTSNAVQPLGYDEEKRVLDLMMQGKTNLAIKNHYTTQDMRLTLEQIQRIRDLAGIPAGTPGKQASTSLSSAASYFHVHSNDTESTLVQRGGAHRDHLTATLSPETTLALRGPAIVVPPDFKQKKSHVTSGAARAVSTFLMAPLRNKGWQGTLIALGLYFVCIYLLFLTMAHVAVTLLHCILAHKVISTLIFSFSVWMWYLYLTRQAAKLSEPTRGLLQRFYDRVSLVVLVAIREMLTNLERPKDDGQPRDGDEYEASKAHPGWTRSGKIKKADEGVSSIQDVKKGTAPADTRNKVIWA